MGSGLLYGFSSVMVGQPFDTVKTKMQAMKGFESHSLWRTLARTVRERGVTGLYRGGLPMFCSAGLFMSTAFASFEATYTFLDNRFGRFEMPMTGGIQNRVIVGGLVSALCRSIVETPLEFIKVRRQTHLAWKLRHIYTGFGVTCCRTIGLMCTYFVLVDSGRRHIPELFSIPLLGPFITGAMASTVSWWVVWPLEYMKSQVQGSYGRDQSVVGRMRSVVRERGGFLALYRGIGPGTIRSIIANGTSMVVMANAQKKASEWGLRGTRASYDDLQNY